MRIIRLSCWNETGAVVLSKSERHEARPRALCPDVSC